MISGHTYIDKYRVSSQKDASVEDHSNVLKGVWLEITGRVVDGPKAHHKETWRRNDDIE